MTLDALPSFLNTHWKSSGLTLVGATSQVRSARPTPGHPLVGLFPPAPPLPHTDCVTPAQQTWKRISGKMLRVPEQVGTDSLGPEVAKAWRGAKNGRKSSSALVANTILPHASSNARMWMTLAAAVSRAHFTTHPALRSVRPRACSSRSSSKPTQLVTVLPLVLFQESGQPRTSHSKKNTRMAGRKCVTQNFHVAVIGE